ncbi:NADH:flavin oxidoreductase/NADH oxidase [Pollutimonas bauzanensis]|uniref:NADH:flavin oxidoreductase/NADH oxidase n=1 Tax=Pollutimonas bauzanensis TaxID=658167 RepID=UPI00334031E0
MNQPIHSDAGVIFDHIQDQMIDRPLLLSPLTLRTIQLRNRIVIAPMCQYASKDGSPTDWHLVHLGKFAIGGAGIVFGEETAIEPLGRKTYKCAGIWSDAHIAQYRRINDFIKAHGSVPAIQLGHAGGKASCHGALKNWIPLTPENSPAKYSPWTVTAPSVINSSQQWPKVKEMDRQDIQAALAQWREATLRSVDAGFDVLEIHGAHGYLIHEFLSPLTNLRTDAYGGDREGRMRFALEVAEIVRAAWPQTLPLFFRVSAVDGKGGVWDMDDTVVLARELKARGVDVIDCSSGGVTGSTSMPIVPRVPGYQVEYAHRVRQEADIQTMAVGMITTAHQAEDILRNGQADLVALAREVMWNPHWPAHAAEKLGDEQAYDLLPHDYAFRLHRRDEECNMPVNRVT